MVRYLYTRPRRRNLPYRLNLQRPLDIMEDLFVNMVFVTLEPDVHTHRRRVMDTALIFPI